MRRIVWLWLWAGLIAGKLPASTIYFQISDLGSNVYRYNYFLSDIAFLANQELDIRFAPHVYGTLSNAQAGVAFAVVLIQPNNPPGSFGDYLALSLVNNLRLGGPFSVDFVLLGAGVPGAQPFFINQFDANGNYLSTPLAGFTEQVPEPGSILLCGLGLFVVFWWRARLKALQADAAGTERA
jgi:hypothetical protein